uniref:Putative endocytosis/signaling protein ehd1 n=1 Tax=Nyssomyia neivai TaxID=330878 RepID=A0A1L8DJG2_9DIPT
MTRSLTRLLLLVAFAFLAVSLHDGQVHADVGPSESECRPYIEKAIHDLKSSDSGAVDENDGSPEADTEDTGGPPGEDDGDDSTENAAIEETSQEGDNGEDENDENVTKENQDDDDDDENDDGQSQEQVVAEDSGENGDDNDDNNDGNNDDNDDDEGQSQENEQDAADDDDDNDDDADNNDQDDDDDDNDGNDDGQSQEQVAAEDSGENGDENDDNNNGNDDDEGQSQENEQDTANDDDDDDENDGNDDNQSQEEVAAEDSGENADDGDDEKDAEGDDEGQSQENEQDAAGDDDDDDDNADDNNDQDDDENDDGKSQEQVTAEDSGENENEKDEEKDDDDDAEDNNDQDDDDNNDGQSQEQVVAEDSGENADDKDEQKDADDDNDEEGQSQEKEQDTADDDDDDDDDEDNDDDDDENPEEELTLESEIPVNRRSRDHIAELLHLDDESELRENANIRVADVIYKDLKRIYETSIKPLEGLYKYRDLSNRHFGDPEIFSKPLVLFMGPWSGGKSTLINYLTDNEFTEDSLRTGAEPSPAYFNILMWGEKPEVLDGTQLAADWTFSGLQKFGQGLEDRLRGLKLPSKLLEKVNIVEIPGILEVRKQVSRLFPFNDACQWFIDRADIIFLVYDPSKLDVGPETEAILDQLKGREYQTRIILNKADQVKPEELMRVQSALIWNISPLMSSAQPPIMYTTSLWSVPFEGGAPVRLLQAQERALLRDLRSAIDKRIENKIASARRFAVRVRNHAKMVDCYLTTYYNHKSLFGNKKQISDQIIEHPQNYHIYEGLSTLTNISRYDLPDPEVYRDFFRLNPLYEFKKLSETCTYFRGCPINKLDVSIAYDLPELGGKYKKLLEASLAQLEKEADASKESTGKS